MMGFLRSTTLATAFAIVTSMSASAKYVRFDAPYLRIICGIGSRCQFIES
jgi:hypothetical protein